MLERIAIDAIRVTLLGETRAIDASGRSLLPRGRKARAIFALLCLSSGHGCTRARLAAMLWDRSSDAAARLSLRQSLYELSAALEPQFLRIERDVVRLERSRFTIDLDALFAIPDGAEASPAVDGEVDPGRLLDDLAGVSRSFDDWLAVERSMLQSHLTKAFDRALEAAAADRLPARRRQSIAAHVLRIEPTHEAACRTMMRALAECGEPAQAVKEFERCRAAILSQFDIEPSPETRALNLAIRASAVLPMKAAHAGARPFAVAVAPFANLSGDGDPFAAAITANIVGALSRYRSFTVIARGEASGTAAGLGQSPRYVLDGSVQKTETRVRVSVRLHETERGSQLWAESFDSAAGDALDVQDSLTEQVVAALFPNFRLAEIERLKTRQPDRLTASELIVKGRAAVHHGLSGLTEAIGLMQRAIEADPDDPFAHAFGAWAYTLRAGSGMPVDQPHDTAEALRLAYRALDLAPANGEVLSMAGLAINNFSGPDRAVPLLDRAIDLNPRLYMAQINRGIACLSMGEPERAIIYAERAKLFGQKDSMPDIPMQVIAGAHLQLGDFEQAFPFAEAAYLSRPGAFANVRNYMVSAALTGQQARAREAVALILARLPGLTVTRALWPSIDNWKRDCDRELFAEGLRRAGLPG